MNKKKGDEVPSRTLGDASMMGVSIHMHLKSIKRWLGVGGPKSRTSKRGLGQAIEPVEMCVGDGGTQVDLESQQTDRDRPIEPKITNLDVSTDGSEVAAGVVRADENE